MPRQSGKVDASARWPRCPACGHKHEPGSECAEQGAWAGGGAAARAAGVTWLIRPMPDGQWPPDQRSPRDDSFSWLVRSHCGHEGGGKLWAFYRREDAEQYEGIFQDNPCHYTQCSRSKTRRR